MVLRSLVAAVLAAGLAGCGPSGGDGSAGPAPPAAAAAFEPEPEPTAERTPARAAEPRLRGRHLTARLTRPARLRAAPGGRTLARLGRRTEFGSRHVLAVVGRRPGWLRVVSAALPNHRRGWIPASAATLGATDHDIVVDRSQRRATLRRDGRAVLSFTVAVGRPGNETPLGRFAVTDKLRPSDPTSPYGCCAVALSGHQTKLVPGWPGGDRLAIHGTPATWSVGRAVSLGCMRATRRSMERLMRRVPLGAPVFIRR